MKKNKYFLLFFVVILFLLFTHSCTVLAYEIKYPDIPGLPSINNMDPNHPNLGMYVGYFFGLGTYIAGILALISFAIGAVGLISPNIASHNDAKDRMIGSILGLVLTIASFIIIKTINPTIITPTLTPLSGTAGIYYSNGTYQLPVAQSVADTSTRTPGYDQLQYCCNTDCNGGTGKNVLVWGFQNKGLETNNNLVSGVSVVSMSCGQKINISGYGSFKTAFENPGIYFYLGAGCSGYASGPFTNPQDDIKNLAIKSAKIINDPINNYGAIFHKEIGLDNGGQCSALIKDEGCSNIGVSVAAADIFSINQDPITSGGGVTFYSEPYGWDSGAKAGFLSLSGSFLWENPQIMKFIYTNIDRPDAYKNTYKTFQDKPGSIQIKGNYLVALYSNSSYCRTFNNKNANNLEADPFLAPGSGAKALNGVWIIPTQ